MSFLLNLDIGITNLINSVLPHTPLFTAFFSFFSLRGNSVFIWIAVIILSLIFEERKNPGISRRDLSFVFTFIVIFTFASLASQWTIKNIVKRPRPCQRDVATASVAIWVANCPQDYSFPSSHATTAFASAAVIAAYDKKRKWFYYLLALLISLSRIYLGVHYFLDVFAGAVFGWLICQLTLKITPIFKHFFYKS